jgi:hypothetical protein
MNETPKPKSGWRIPRQILIALASLATLIAIFYAEEDWRGKRDWDTYRCQWEAKGEKFDWHDFVPPSVPDDQNFFTSPIFTNLLANRVDLSIYRDDGTFPKLRHDVYWAGGIATDLQAWQDYYHSSTNGFPISPQPQTPAADVLLALSKYDSTIEQLRAAANRPYANVPMNYEDGFGAASTLLPYLAELKRCSLVLQLRASAELANGQSAKACDDVKLLFRLNNSVRSQPFLITQLVRFAILSITLQPVWEGMANHEWTDDQLAQIQAELAKEDFLADFEFYMRGERAFAIQSLENQRITCEQTVMDVTGKTNTIHYYFMPSAYFYQNELALAQASEQQILPFVDINARTLSPEAVEKSTAALQSKAKPFSLYKMQARMTLPVVEATAIRCARAQSSVDLACVACALERYHLARGEYPDTLDPLTPQFIKSIPHDILNGQPLHYCLTDDGKYLLYSVGWNLTDDGGQIGRASNGNVDIRKGDWVWPVIAR